MIIKNKANLSTIEAAVLSDFFEKRGYEKIRVCAWDYDTATYHFTFEDSAGKFHQGHIEQVDLPNIRRNQLRVTENWKRNGQDLAKALEADERIPDPDVDPLTRIDRAIKQIPEIKGHGKYYQDGIIEELRRAKIQLQKIIK